MIDRYELLGETVEALDHFRRSRTWLGSIGDPLLALGAWRFGREAVAEIPGRYELYLVDERPIAGRGYRERRRLWSLGIRERDVEISELLGIPPAYAAGLDRAYTLTADPRYPRIRADVLFETDYADGIFDAAALDLRLIRAGLITGGI